MKPIYSYALLAAFAAVGSASAVEAVTTPVGYETITLLPAQFNLTGARLFTPQVAAGTFESHTATTLVDNQATFSLVADTSYVIEFPNGATITALGSDISGTTVSNLTGIDATYEGTYLIRPASTIASVFGAANQAGLASSPNADSTEADVIFIPDGSGGFTQIFYSTYINTEGGTLEEQQQYFGWLNAETSAKVPNFVINADQGFFVNTQVSASNITMTVSGEVKKTPTAFSVDGEFTLLGSVYPAGATLTTSGLSAFVQPSANADSTEADKVLLPNGLGGFVTAFYSTYLNAEGANLEEQEAFFGWLNADDSSKIPNQPMTPGFFLQLVGPGFSGINSTPTFYTTL